MFQLYKSLLPGRFNMGLFYRRNDGGRIQRGSAKRCSLQEHDRDNARQCMLFRGVGAIKRARADSFISDMRETGCVAGGGRAGGREPAMHCDA